MWTEALGVCEALGVAGAMCGSLLVTSPRPQRRRLGFTFFIASSILAFPVMYSNGLYTYGSLQVFYLWTSILGFTKITQYNSEEN